MQTDKMKACKPSDMNLARLLLHATLACHWHDTRHVIYALLDDYDSKATHANEILYYPTAATDFTQF